MRADDLPGCMRDLKDGNVDFVIAYQSAGAASAPSPPSVPWGKSPETLETLIIGTDKLIPVCKPGADGRPVFSFDNQDIEMPFLRFGDNAPIGRHLELLFRERSLSGRLRTVYENTMAGALRIRARAGDGVAWLPKSLVAPDLDSGLLVRTGQPDWDVSLDIRLYRDKERTNRVTRSIWSFLQVRQSVSLLANE